MLPVPSNATPPMLREDASAVAVAALPLHDPDDPDALPVTLPVKAPTKVVAVTTPVNLASPVTVKAEVAVVVPIPTLVVVVIPVSFTVKGCVLVKSDPSPLNPPRAVTIPVA